MASGKPAAALDLLNAMLVSHPGDVSLRRLVVNAENEFCELADASGRFAVNILNDAQQSLSNVFAGLDPNVEDRFETIGHWTTLTGGTPILADALVALDCERRDKIVAWP